MNWLLSTFAKAMIWKSNGSIFCFQRFIGKVKVDRKAKKRNISWFKAFIWAFCLFIKCQFIRFDYKNLYYVVCSIVSILCYVCYYSCIHISSSHLCSINDLINALFSLRWSHLFDKNWSLFLIRKCHELNLFYFHIRNLLSENGCRARMRDRRYWIFKMQYKIVKPTLSLY